MKDNNNQRREEDIGTRRPHRTPMENWEKTDSHEHTGDKKKEM